MILGSCITVSFIKKTNIRNSIPENQQHYDRKIFQFDQMSMSFSTSSSSITLKNGAASVISSSNTVGGGGDFHSRGPLIDGFYLLGGRLLTVFTF